MFTGYAVMGGIVLGAAITPVVGAFLMQSNDHTLSIDTPVRGLVFQTVSAVADEQGKKLLPLSDETVLMECGLDSLCIAIIVARLDDQLGVDPFGSAEDMVLPVTLRDFVEIYQNAAA